jgi:hypothetical protein
LLAQFYALRKQVAQKHANLAIFPGGNCKVAAQNAAQKHAFKHAKLAN